MPHSPPDSALLIVDMINRFDFDGGPALAEAAEPASRAIARLRRRFHDAGAPVIYVNDNFADWRSDFHELVATCSHPASPGAGTDVTRSFHSSPSAAAASSPSA